MCEMCEGFKNARRVTRPPVEAETLVEVVAGLNGVQLVLPSEFLPVPTGALFA